MGPVEEPRERILFSPNVARSAGDPCSPGGRQLVAGHHSHALPSLNVTRSGRNPFRPCVLIGVRLQPAIRRTHESRARARCRAPFRHSTAQPYGRSWDGSRARRDFAAPARATGELPEGSCVLSLEVPSCEILSTVTEPGARGRGSLRARFFQTGVPSAHHDVRAALRIQAVSCAPT